MSIRKSIIRSVHDLNIRIRIYSTRFGNEDFVGTDEASLVARAKQKVAYYRKGGTHAHYVGRM